MVDGANISKYLDNFQDKQAVAPFLGKLLYKLLLYYIYLFFLDKSNQFNKIR